MVVGVRFGNSNKIYDFNCEIDNILIGDNVIVETEKGLQYGQVVKFSLSHDREIKNVIRKATESDEKKNKDNTNKSMKVLIKARELADKYELNMKIIDACYTFDRSQLMLKFIAEERIDFRQLAKDLGTIYKTRIELRQIGIRDKAKEIGGLGPCGRKLCCNSFLKEFDSVSINMAKNQNLALNPSKINGVCGRLLCCLKYEDESYKEYKKGLPKVNSKVSTENGISGKVLSVDVFNRNYRLLTENNEVIVVNVDDC